MEPVKKNHFLIYWLIVIIAFQYSCTPESCMQQTQTFVKATFYKNDGTGINKAPDTLTIFGVGNEGTLIYNKAVRQLSVLIPLDATRERCQFVFKINNRIDTVSFIYSSYPHFISKECGYTYFHQLEDIPTSTHNIIDTIEIKSKSVVLPNGENIKIFYN
jgi:hypothetical protein